VDGPFRLLSLDQVNCIGAGGGAGAGYNNGAGSTASGSSGAAFAQITNLSVTPGSTIAFQIGAGGAGGVNAVILDTTAWPHFSPARQPFRPSMDLVGAAAMELALLLELLAAPRPASDR